MAQAIATDRRSRVARGTHERHAARQLQSARRARPLVAPAVGAIQFGTVMPWYLLSIGVERWTPVLSGVSRDGQTFTKTGGADSTYDAAFRSLESYVRCAIQWKFDQTNLEVGVGLSTVPDADDDFDTINFWMYCT